METRRLAIHDGILTPMGVVHTSDYPDVTYHGLYFEEYETVVTGKKGKPEDQTEFRIGHIYDAVKHRIAVFRQYVDSRDDLVPCYIATGEIMEAGGEGVIEAGAKDPQNADQRSPYINCNVCEFTVREPTVDDMRKVRRIRRGDRTSDSEPDAGEMLTVAEAATYAQVDERTIREWLRTNAGNAPMITGVVGKGRLTRIPRRSLIPYRKKAKATRKSM